MYEEKYYTVAEIAKRLKVSVALIYRLVRSGEMQCHRIGQGKRPAVRITQEQVDDYFRLKDFDDSANRHFR